MTSSADRLLDVDITGIAHGGTFIARHEGRVVFVSDAIPGERVRVRLDDASADPARGGRRFWRAETVEVLDASPHRRPHVWPEADVSREPGERAGGADLGHIALEHQRTLKRQVLAEALAKFAGSPLEAPEVQAVDDTDGRGWRTRVSLHVDQDGVIGPFAARSHRVIPVSSHPLAAPRIEAAALAVRGARRGRIEFVQDAAGEVHELRAPDKGRRPAPRPIVERVAGRDFRVDVDGFWQVHPRAAEVLDRAVRTALAGRVDPDATHFDLYGGVGLFSASLAASGATDIVTVESHPRATAHARHNLEPFDVTAVTARVERYLAALDGATRAGTVVLDPPRAGAGRAVVEALSRLAPEAVVYVACDPVALARDLGTFREHGWQTASLEAFDLFPHSHHLEAVALLTR